MKHLQNILITISLFLLSACSDSKATNETKEEQAYKNPFHAMVAKDGSAQYTSVQAAINAAPENRKEPWIIFIQNGSYEEQVVIPKNKPYIHLIGQDKEQTIIHLKLNVGGEPKEGEEDKTGFWACSVHNPNSPVYQFEGSVCRIEGANFYSENISYINDFGVDTQSGPQALAMSSQADCAAFNQCKFRSFQDTWMTSTKDSHRHYVKDCYIEGAVDYFYGGGDVLVENCTFYNVRAGSIIVAPCHKNAKWGYVFRNCVVDGNELAANVDRWGVKLGRPWHENPKTVYIHTTLNIPINPEGWTDMGTIPALFAEYDTRDAKGNVVDLSRRKTTYSTSGENAKTGTCRATITKEEADTYVYENIIPGSDNWNPRAIMESLPTSQKLSVKGKDINWEEVDGAIGYILFEGDKMVGTTNLTQIQLSNEAKNVLTLRAINSYGSLGQALQIRP